VELFKFSLQNLTSGFRVAFRFAAMAPQRLNVLVYTGKKQIEELFS
jgi:hypothetical protein